MTGLWLHPLVLAALGYLALTLLFQFRPFSTRALGLDLFGIVPRWKFFIPQPGRFEVAIAVRCGSHDDDLGEWTPVPMFPPRHALSWLWSPGQHRGAILWLSAHRVATRAMRGEDAAPDTLAYQTLLRHLRDTAQAQRAGMFQFALLHSGGDSGDRTIFTSRSHDR